MARTYSSVEKIRAELAWVNETQIRTNAAAAKFAVVRKLDTGPERAPVLSQRSSGSFGGSITC